MTIAAALDSALRTAGIPIIGVRVADAGNAQTWTIQFDPSATDAQKTQAATVIASTAVDAATLADADAQAAIDNKMLKAVVIWLAGKLTLTPAAVRTQILAIYKGL